MIKFSTISLALLAIATSQLELDAKDTSRQEESARRLIERCRSSRPFETLADFSQFYENFRLLDECLHSIKEPAKLCQDAETECEQANWNYQDVRPLGVLVERYKSAEAVCTIEFASKIYRLHKRLERAGTNLDELPLGEPLRILANRVASGCRKSLARRLLEVEQRTTKDGAALSESLKHLTAIVSCLNVGYEQLERIEVEPEQVNPIFADELALANRALSIGRDGFELKLTEAMQTYLDLIKDSCSSLRTYQMNLLGSLGALASIGYGFNQANTEQLNYSRLDKIRIHSWSLAAILCQSVSGVLKMSRERVDGKVFRKVKVLISQKADVRLDEEDDDIFASYKLTEETDDRDLGSSDLARDSFKFDSRQINRRKKQLLDGPNYRLVKAIGAYVDPLKSGKRFEIPYEMLGMQPPRDLAVSAADDEDEEE